ETIFEVQSATIKLIDNRLFIRSGQFYQFNDKMGPVDLVKYENELKNMLLKRFPQLEDFKIDYSWSGFIGFTLKRLPLVGKIGDNIYYSVGYSGHGLSLSTLCGKLLDDIYNDNQSVELRYLLSKPSRSMGGPIFRLNFYSKFFYSLFIYCE